MVLEQKGPRRITPFFIPSSLINLASGQVSIRHGFRGPNHSVVTACATGMHAIGDAARIVRAGMADVMVAGGAEASVCRLGIAGFAAMRALSTNFNDSPQRASRPWDEDRDGFVMGEGAGIVVLEEFEHAQARGARIYVKSRVTACPETPTTFRHRHPTGTVATAACKQRSRMPTCHLRTSIT